MTVEDLIDELKQMPQTAMVEIESDDWFGIIIGVNYSGGVVTIRLESMPDVVDDGE